MVILLLLLFHWWFSVCFDSCILPSNTEHTGDFKLAASSVFSLLFFQPKRPDLLEMAHLPYRRHGNFPQRRATLLPWVAKCRVQLALETIPSETGSNPATTAQEARAGHLIQTQTVLNNWAEDYHHSWMSFTVLRKCEKVIDIQLNYWYNVNNIKLLFP